MDAIDAFMRNAINQTRGNVRESIIPMIRDNFNITQEEAEAKFIAFIGEEEVKLGMSENAKLRIRDNPGFKTTLEKEKFSSILNVSMDIQDNLEYLNVVPIYLNSLIQISQGKFSEKTKAVCTRKVEKKDEAIPEIVNPSELPFADNKTPVIEEGEELVFDDEGDDDMLDALLLGSDEDEEEDDDEGGQSEAGQSEAMQSEAGQSEPMVGGAPDDDELVADITGMALSNPNPFSKRMEDRDPALFLKKDQGKFKAYSRMCASNMRRQPVILTEEEKRRIDEEHPGSYSEVIKYGSDPKKPYYYICPRYWSIPENTSLSEEEVLARQQAPLKVGDEVKYKEGDDDKSGTVVEVEDTRIKIKNEDKSESWEPRENVLKDIIIPPDAKKVPKGKTIYEFTVKKGARAHSDFVDADGNYITHYPGFISGDKHPDGLCMPCCFKSWTANEQVRRRRECAQEEGEASSAQVKARREYTGPQKDYIKSHDKFPLEEERMGYLPLELQLFFQEDAKQYQVSELDPSLKDDAVTLLRYGVESSNNQSFIGCIAAVYADTTDEENKQRFIRQFKQVKKQQKQAKKDKTRQELVLQEKQLERKLKELGTPKIKEMREIIANLITIDNFTNFQNGNLVTEFYPGNVDGVSIDDYAGSNLYKQLDTSDEDQVFYFERLIAAYENFLAYLRNDDNEIAYQYLWDIVTMPNPDLFPSGINLVILEIPQDDATSNVNIICPTNHYSRQGFDTNKRTLMLVKKNEFYEPIYLYNNIKGEVSQFLFREQNLLGKPNIKLVLSKIRKYINESCRPLNSMPEKYKYRENIPLDKVVEILAKKEIEITALEVHYNGKAIGVHIKYPDGDEGFIPCYPSNYQVTNDLPIIFMDGKETKNRKNLEETVKFLRKTNRETGLPTKPMCKVEEENLIVGVITETNQLIMLDKPEELREADDQGENETLKICSVKPYEKASKAAISEKGVDTERVRFMNALKREKRNYTEFRNLVRVQLNKLGNIKIKNNILDEINREDKDSLESYQDTIEKIVIHLKTLVNGIVEFVERGKGVNVEEHKYPKKNSLTGADNEEFYYIRLADELLRFKRIQLFMLETNKYLSFSDIHYEINDDELLLLESMINNQFFQGLNAAYKRNTYVHFNTYDTAMPIKTVPYSEKIGVQTLCKIKARSALTEWEQKIVGDEGFSINEFNTASKEQRNTVCTYELIMSILENEKNRNEASKVHDLEDITYQAIKEILIEKYNGYDENKVLNRLYQEGKEQWVRAIRGGKMTLEQYIRSDQYAFTLLDLWMLADYFDIPILFFGQFKMNMNGTKSFATKHYKKGKAKHYYLIRLYKPVQNTYPRYGLVVDPRKSIYININKYTSLLNRFLLLFMDKFGKKTPPPLTIGEYIEN
jgi:sRNA-binding protein